MLSEVLDLSIKFFIQVGLSWFSVRLLSSHEKRDYDIKIAAVSVQIDP